ncbi:hypothetical protein [Dyadobacter tibetensis]|uniref:hypothetical protein n=1 Tax=Dyadobacter tibetensis TaxID=1211851 RepID=UPI0018DE01EA|nr:hypothetical protein [Dyadobacter tibetensis]
MTTGFGLPAFAATNDDLFRQELRYNTNTTAVGATSQNSGYIGQMIWQVKGRAAQAYGFTYDYLDRLTTSRYSNYTAAGGIDPVDYYGESMNFESCATPGVGERYFDHPQWYGERLQQIHEFHH